MNALQQITDSPNQQQTVALADGTTFTITIRFVPQQYGWFITSLVYGNFTLNGYRIINSPNMLNQYQNQIPFGLACQTQGNREPTQQQDFSSGASTIYLLSAAEVKQYAEYLLGSH